MSDIEEILIEERKLLDQRRGEELAGDPVVGIALSGGGIRSGIFNLGLLTSLERAGFVRLADYLSTVSGGGYIGSYLVANRVMGTDLSDDSKDNAALRHLRAFGNYLTPSVGAMSADTWTMMMVWFRNTSMMQLFLLTVFAVMLLLPRLWGLLLQKSIYGRFGEDWSVPLSILIFHLMVAGICGMFIGAFDGVGGFQELAGKREIVMNPARLRRGIFAVTTLALAGSTLFAIGAFGPFARGGMDMRELETRFAMTLGTCGFYLALFSLGYARGFYAKRPEAIRWVMGLIFVAVSTSICAGLFGFDGLPVVVRVACSVGLGAFLLMAGQRWVFRTESKEWRMDIWRSTMAGLACGGASYAGLLAAETFHGGAAHRATLLLNSPGMRMASSDIWQYAMFAAPGLLATLGCCIVVLIAVAGRAMPDLVREAWSRLGALLYMKSLAMLVIGVVGVYGPLVILTAWASWNSYVLASGGVATAIFGLFTVMAANSGSTGKKKGGGSTEFLAQAGPPLFIVLLFCVVSMVIHAVFVSAALSGEAASYRMVPATAEFQQCASCVGLGTPAVLAVPKDQFMDCPTCVGGWWNGPGWPAPQDLLTFHWQFLDASVHWQWPLVAQLLAGLFVLAIFLASRLDVNEYSINRFYRNRLARCFVGAARAKIRQPNPVTGFDANDDVQMSVVRQCVEADSTTPIPVINTALNTIGGTNAAMEERRAESFFFTPMAAYSDPTGRISMEAMSTGRLPGDVTLGSLIAISGAAANPNMGYHTSATVSFLLTFFNVRLGWWAGVPQKMQWWKRQFNLSYVFFELFGTADTDDAYVNLSDGGHFENLGLYELVRRKCRLIVVGDGEEDGKYIFESLGMAIRKCRIDFEAEIKIDVSPIQPAEEGGVCGRHWAVGEITYADKTKGYLVYVKSSFTGREPYDVKQYRYLHPEFPQQSTGDQFFDESQFESYRQLGLHAGEELMGALLCKHAESRQEWVTAAKGLYR